MTYSEEVNSTNEIDVNMGECKVINGESQQYLKTDGLGPCVGVAIVIETPDGRVHRLLGHIIMEERPRQSFTELKDCIKIIRSNTKDSIISIEITLVTNSSYRNRTALTVDEKKLLNILLKSFETIKYQDIKFKYSQQVQISPDGVISTSFRNKKEIEVEK